MKTKQTMGAGQVLDVLGEKHFKGNAYEMLREVRNATGYGGERSADALVVSVWPSRGVWFGGVEVKVARNDWLRELAEPAKSHAVQKFCSYWWIATPPDIVRAGELPETWGHIEVTEKSAKVLVQAPKLAAEPPSATFVASVLRNQAANVTRIESAAHQRGYELASKRFEGAEDAVHLKAQLEQSEARGRRVQQDRDAFFEQIATFERETGVSLSGYRGQRAPEEFKALQRAVRALDGVDLGKFAALLRNTAKQVDNANAELRAAREQQEVRAAE